MNDYPTVAAIERWKHYLPLEQLHVGFYDLLCEDPTAFYGQISNFLGIDPQLGPPQIKAQLGARVYEGRSLPISRDFEVYLAQKWTGEVEKLCEVFSPYPQRWRVRYSIFLASGENPRTNLSEVASAKLEQPR